NASAGMYNGICQSYATRTCFEPFEPRLRENASADRPASAKTLRRARTTAFCQSYATRTCFEPFEPHLRETLRRTRTTAFLTIFIQPSFRLRSLPLVVTLIITSNQSQ